MKVNYLIGGHYVEVLATHDSRDGVPSVGECVVLNKTCSCNGCQQRFGNTNGRAFYYKVEKRYWHPTKGEAGETSV